MTRSSRSATAPFMPHRHVAEFRLGAQGHHRLYGEDVRPRASRPKRSPRCCSMSASKLYGGQPGDMRTTVGLQSKSARASCVNLMIGPPSTTRGSSTKMHEALFSPRAGKRIVCGGTTTRSPRKYLGKEPVNATPRIPRIPMFRPPRPSKGVDLGHRGRHHHEQGCRVREGLP